MVALACVAGPAAAQGYPNRPIKVIVPFQAGSAPGQIMRSATHHRQPLLGQPFVIENKPGANGNIGVAEAARAAPAGTTRQIVEKLYGAAEKALATQEVRTALTGMSFNVEPMNPDEFTAYIRSENAK